jgi:hypothetical protein
MKVFLSWSGGRSKAVAEELGSWLARVIQAVEPWISSGIEKGARWQGEIADRLEEAKVGIVCLTSSNLTAPWILFEAGALSKTKGSYVCTFLLDVTPADIEPPLGQFQHTAFTKDDALKLVQTINKAVKDAGDRALTGENLIKVFETFWPQLKATLSNIAVKPEEKPAPRPEREVLEEILEIVRSQEQAARKEREQKEAVEAWSSLYGPAGPLWSTVYPPVPQHALAAYEKLLSSTNKPAPESGPTQVPPPKSPKGPAKK